MARKHTTATELARMLHSIRQPIYVLNKEYTLVFCNQACFDWLGQAADELLGCKCVYSGPPSTKGLEAIASGLCPPPTAMAGENISATVSYSTSQGTVRFRRARFVPLLEVSSDKVSEEILFLVVTVSDEDLSDVEPFRGTDAQTIASAPELSEAAQLHARIQKHRTHKGEQLGIGLLIGQTPAARRARTQVELAIANRASVLILGPPGSGRQRVAETIHYGRTAKQREGTLIPLACSVLGSELLHSTLGVLAHKSTLGEKAKQSTLLLNDVGQIPPEVQKELVELLDSNTLLPRVLATGEESLFAKAAEGAFREDLAALLSTMVIELPSLVERRADIPLLAQFFLEQKNVAGSKQLEGFTSEAMDRLDAYRWPGNIDELAQMVHEACEQAEGPLVEVEDLPRRIHQAADAEACSRIPEETIVLDEFLGHIERELIERALRRSKGNKTKAAKLLGMTRPRLYRRLVQLGLEEKEPTTPPKKNDD